jgi:hypothetical protein
MREYIAYTQMVTSHIILIDYSPSYRLVLDPDMPPFMPSVAL